MAVIPTVMYAGPPPLDTSEPWPAMPIVPLEYKPAPGLSHEQVRRMIDAEVERALRDPARLIDALLRLSLDERARVMTRLAGLPDREGYWWYFNAGAWSVTLVRDTPDGLQVAGGLNVAEFKVARWGSRVPTPDESNG